jgi:hypothetical protein
MFNPQSSPSEADVNLDDSAVWDDTNPFDVVHRVHPTRRMTLGYGYVEGQFNFRNLLHDLKQNEASLPGKESSERSGVAEKTAPDPDQEPPQKRQRIEKPKTQALDWTNFIIPSAHFIGSGGFGDVHEGEWTNIPVSVDIQSVPRIVVKKFRVASAQTPDAKARIRVLAVVLHLHELSNPTAVTGNCCLAYPETREHRPLCGRYPSSGELPFPRI